MGAEGSGLLRVGLGVAESCALARVRWGRGKRAGKDQGTSPQLPRDPRPLRTGEGGVEFWANRDDASVERLEQTQPPKPGPRNAESWGDRAPRLAGPTED